MSASISSIVYFTLSENLYGLLCFVGRRLKFDRYFIIYLIW